MKNSLPVQLRSCDGAVIALDCKKKHYFSEYISKKNKQVQYSKRAISRHVRKGLDAIRPLDNLNCCRYFKKNNNTVEFYASDDSGKLFVSNAGSEAVRVIQAGILTVILPGYTVEIGNKL